jgi:hypothetical protein
MKLSDTIRYLNHPNEQLVLIAKEKLKDFFNTADLDLENNNQKRLLRKLKKMDCLVARELLYFYEETRKKTLVFEDELLNYIHHSRIKEKDFYEAKCFYQKVSPLIAHVPRILDCCAGQGLAGIIFALEGKADEVTLVDIKRNSHYSGLLKYVQSLFPIKVDYQLKDINKEPMPSADLIISIHACNDLTDKTISAALKQQVPFAVMPCCYSKSDQIENEILDYFPEKATAIDIARITYAQSQGYQVQVRRINNTITDKNRIIIGVPR